MLLIPYGETSCCRWYTTPYRRYMNSHTRRTRLIPSCSLAPSLSARKWDRSRGILCSPLVFCLPLQPVLRSMRSGFRIGYLDDLSLGGKKDDVIALIENLESSLGLVLNRNKCELYSNTESTETEFEGFEQMDTGSLLLLGAPLFKGAALDKALMKHGETLGRAVTEMACLRTQAALILLRASFGAAKLTFSLRTAPCYAHPALGRMDDEIRRGLENILNISLNDIQWLQATLPIRDGGLGVRRVSMLATSAYLASAASTKSLVSAILNKEEWGDAHLDELLEARKNTQPGSAESIYLSMEFI